MLCSPRRDLRIISSAMEEKSGVEASMDEGEMKDYVELVIKELLRNRIPK